MECDICRRGHDSKRLPFLCAVDARNQIYEGRIKHLQLLIENEGLQQQVTDLLENTTSPAKVAQPEFQAQQRRAEDRTTQILAAADKLREDIKSARAEIEARKAALSRRKSDLISVRGGLAERRARQQEEMERSLRRLRFRWFQSAENMARTRAFLCREAATLYGLKRVRKGSPGQYDYYLGRVPVVDLTDLMSLSPEATSTSLAHISHVLILASHYLSIRLPAAITLPHRDYPQPTILNFETSYVNGDTTFPTFSGEATTPGEMRDPNIQYAPRPRPLYLDKSLSLLCKEDPATYAYFLEGVALLAYDIAWACCTQGVPVGDEGSFEDVCNIGRNLYNLLIAQETAKGVLYPGDSGKPTAAAKTDKDDQVLNWMGRYSHSTSYYFLEGAEGTKFSDTFKLPPLVKVFDKLKARFANETPSVDWEVVDDEAWKPEEDRQGSISVENQKPTDKVTSAAKSSPRRGSSGWMKVKNR